MIFFLVTNKQLSLYSVYTYAKRSHMHVKDPVVHVRVWWTMETTTKNIMH